jgi:single-strand DNA-binding protein
VNEIQVSLRGNVATEPKQLHFDDGNSLTSFRLASNARWFDRDRREWIDRGTTYVSVNCRRAMGLNAIASVRKGQPVVVTGRLQEKSWSSNGQSGRSLTIEAETLGHDLSFGTTEFTRIVRTERNGTVGTRVDDHMAYLLAKESDGEQAGQAGRAATDVTGLVVLDDADGPEHEFDPEADLAAEELVAALSGSVVG